MVTKQKPGAGKQRPAGRAAGPASCDTLISTIVSVIIKNQGKADLPEMIITYHDAADYYTAVPGFFSKGPDCGFIIMGGEFG